MNDQLLNPCSAYSAVEFMQDSFTCSISSCTI